MTSKDGSHPLLARLEAILAIHGARPERWPQEMRARLSAFIDEEPAAARLFAEARALDRLLGAAPDPAPPYGLEARILAAATQPGRRPPAIRAKRGMWPEAALLAASLFIGFVIGLSGGAMPALQDVALISGFFEADGLPEQEAL
jgi:anti-sigma factor RsiW